MIKEINKQIKKLLKIFSTFPLKQLKPCGVRLELVSNVKIETTFLSDI